MNIFLLFFVMIVIGKVIYKAKEETQRQDKGSQTVSQIPPKVSALPQGATLVRPMSVPNTTAPAKPIVLPKEPKQELEQTTTEYLAQKAATDQREHDLEDKKTQARISNAYGNVRSGERILMGDSIPNGKREVICGYCGAENLVSETARENYTCYFCRELL